MSPKPARTFPHLLAIALLAGLGGACVPDADGDGFGATVDCDDADADVFPGAPERCDGTDTDCDGEADLGAADASVFFADGDGDGFGDPGVLAIACEPPSGHVAVAGDCDDTDAAVLPGVARFADRDGDGFGDDATPLTTCGEPIGTAATGGDCDDHQDDVNPDAVETCNTVDDDCDLSVDEGAVDAPFWYDDLDQDGHGDPNAGAAACDRPGTGAASSDDCDDGDGTRFPGAAETCDGVDDDCDGVTDEGAVDAATWFPDLDGDGYGWGGAPFAACVQPDDFVANASDCDDVNATDHPGGVERCDHRDNDCDGTVDGAGAVDPGQWYRDDDGDGFGDGSPVTACFAPPFHVAMPWDCNDGEPAISPMEPEICDDGVDNDCNAFADDCGGGGTPVGDYPMDAAEADLLLVGNASTWAGFDLALADHDGDGADDLLVGGPGVVNGSVEWGGVWLAYGAPTEGLLGDAADAFWMGGASGDQLGFDVAGVGDLDGDGFDEFAAFAPGYVSSDGAVYLRYGGATRAAGDGVVDAWDARIAGYFSNALGYGVTGVGDVDGDGLDDMAWGRPAYDWMSYGSVQLLYGDATRIAGDVLPNSVPLIFGNGQEQLGRGRGVAGDDFDGDGLSDVAMAADGQDASVVYVLYGDPARVPASQYAANLPQLTGSPDGETGFGDPLVAPGDLDGDGYQELLISSRDDDQISINGGSVWLLQGSATRWSGTTPVGNGWSRISSLDQQISLGADATGVGDLDGDGVDDLAVSAQYTDGAQPDVGAVYLYWGLAGGMLRTSDAGHVLLGTVSAGNFGRRIAHGDVDGDGNGDLLVSTGDWSYDGRVYVFLGSF